MTVKSAAFVPVIEILWTAKLAVPLLVNCKGSCLAMPVPTDPKERLVGLETRAPPPIPLPARVTVFGPFPELLARFRVATRAPDPVGVNAKLNTTEALGFNDIGNVALTKLKSPLFVPVNVTPLMFNVAVPELVTVRGTEL